MDSVEVPALLAAADPSELEAVISTMMYLPVSVEVHPVEEVKVVMGTVHEQDVATQVVIPEQIPVIEINERSLFWNLTV
jgi:hypothetical protein